MVDSSKRTTGGFGNEVQAVEVRGLQGPDAGPVRSAGDGWRISLRAMRVHNNHLLSGKRTLETCGMCTEGLAGALAQTAERFEYRPDEMAEGDGDNKADDSALSRGDGTDREPEGEVSWR